MEYSKIKKDQIVLLDYIASTGKDKGKTVYTTISKVKGKVRNSKSKVRLIDLDMGIGYNVDTKKYEGCNIANGWFKGERIKLENEKEMDNWDVFDCKQTTLLIPIVKSSQKKHKLIGKISNFRVHLYRYIPSKLGKECGVRFLTINTRDSSINGCMFKLSYKKKESDWIHFASSIDPKEIEAWMIEFKNNFIKI